MTERPYRNCSIDQFERLAEAGLSDDERARILDELRRRTTQRARALEQLLGGSSASAGDEDRRGHEVASPGASDPPFADWSTERLERLVKSCTATMRGTVQAELNRRRSKNAPPPTVFTRLKQPTARPAPASTPRRTAPAPPLPHEGPPMPATRPPTVAERHLQPLKLEDGSSKLGDTPFERHEIACGDSATFQGKERDIMFVSMVECAKTATSKTATMFEQRFNVALSRARDRMVLVYSVDEQRLKPNDLKAKVLRHFRDPMLGSRPEGDDPFALCQSGFEQSVLGYLLQRRYRAMPQVRVGAYAIDIVVEGGNDRRLAIELDGDKWHGPDRWQDDLFRQRVLERCGWRFWRCWGSSYHLDPAGCMADLKQELARLGIEPIGAEWRPPIYTAFRTVTREPAGEGAATPQAIGGDQASVISEPSFDETEETSPPPSTSPPQPAEQVLAIDDRFIMAYMHEPAKQFCLTMTADDHRPDVGLVAANHMIFRQFLGAGEEEQIDVNIDGKRREAVILKIDKAPQVYRQIASTDETSPAIA